MKTGVENFDPNKDPVWSELAQYLSPHDLMTLYEGSKAIFSRLFSTDLLWQEPLNRLHIMNDSVNIKPTNGQSLREAFIAGFHFIKEEQQAEIHLLTAHHCFRLKNKDQIVYLSTLQERHIELARRNWNIILPLARRAKFEGSQKLDLSSSLLTRIPRGAFYGEDLKDFWENLKVIDCSFNFIKKLPHAVRVLKSLREFHCHHNYLESLPGSLFNLPHLEKIDASHNKLRDMPDESYYRSRLVILDLEGNNLSHLAPSILFKFREIQPRKSLNDELLSLMSLILNEQDETSLEESISFTTAAVR